MRNLSVTALLLCAAAAFSTLSACGGATSASTTPAAAMSGPAAASAVKPNGEAHIGDKTVCPISGEEFVVTDASPKVDYKGKTYYFCCGGCDKKFQANPESFLNKKTTG